MSCPPDPLRPTNRPGLPELAYRIGDYASFRQRLIERLICAYPTLEHPSGISLAKLTTRASDDPAIALLDACAMVADVLTFYQERIANEGFLATATERRSVLELARMLGYELNPGVAASTMLAFSVDTAPGSPSLVTVPKGTQIMSVPEKDELPQTFETSQEFIARVEWNALKPRSSRPQVITSSTRQLYLDGITAQLQAGDSLLLRDGDDQKSPSYLLTLAKVAARPDLNTTLVTWEQSLPATIQKPLVNPQVFAFRQQASLFGNSAPRWNEQSNEIKQANGGTVRGGVLRSDNSGDRWILCNTSLPNVDILSLAAVNNTVFAGTAGKGIFRSRNKGTSWEALNTGLTNLSVQVLYVDEETKYLYAGTPGGGLFRSKDNGDNWVPIHLGGIQIVNLDDKQFQTVSTALPNTVVRSVLVHRIKLINITGTGTISSEGTEGKTVKGANTKFPLELKEGDTITALGQPKKVIRIDSATSLEVESAFNNPSLPSGTTFQAVTSRISFTRGVRRVEDIRTSSGTISSQGNTVTGNNTNFSVLRRGNTPRSITATVNGQTKIISHIDGETSLQITDAFTRGVLDPGTPFLISNADSKHYLFVGTDDGVYYSEDEGKNWKPFGLLDRAVYSLILSNGKKYLFAGTDQGVYYISDTNATWQSVSASGLSDRRIHTLVVSQDGNLLAGTPTGIFRLTNLSDSTLQTGTWTQLATGLINQVQTLAVNSAGRIFAGTLVGAYRSKNSETDWEQSNGQDLTELNSQILSGLNVTSLASLTFNSEESFFAGSRFSGFVENEWPDFLIARQLIDLNTLYPKILEDSWIVLLNGDYFEAHQVQKLSTPSITDFTITSKVTQIKPVSAIAQPARFDRRSTVVFVQSEPLTLAAEILTIPIQKNKILVDPIWENKVFLSQYVPGLQPQKQVIVSGKRIRVEIKQVGGVFSLVNSADGEEHWQRTNQGLTNTAVTAFATRPPDNTSQNDLIIGTADGGVFRFQDNGKTWVAINSGLTNLKIQAIAINNHGTLGQKLFAGTPKGVFRHTATEPSPNGQPPNVEWEQMNVNTVHQDVRAIAIHPNTGLIVIGTLNGGVFHSSDNGNTWAQTGLSNTDVQTIAFIPNHSIEPDQRQEQIVAGTVADGVFYSSDGGASWNAINTGLTNLNVTALTISSRTEQPVLLAGTAGSGIFRMSFSTDIRNLTWEPSSTNPTDLMIRCLAVHPISFHLFAGTASKGIFRSLDDGNLWGAINTGLTSVDPLLNPGAIVNTDVRAIVILNNQLFAAGIGILISPSTLLPVPLQVGDRLQLLARPQPLQGAIQHWQLQDRNGFIGSLITTSAADIELHPATVDDVLVSEAAIILNPPVEQQHPILTLMEPIQNSYDPSTVNVFANVVAATHGETTIEPLGNGDGTATNQQFVLKKPPLTYVSAPTASGSETTLQVRVNDVLWQQVPSLYQQPAQEQSYIAHTEDDGTTRIIFGDGRKGARLPTGQENVVATYRSGIGLAAQVSANALSLLKTRPLGISEVTNPFPATGAAEPETMAEARTSAPLTVRTMGRIVSLQDYEDFARAFVGIGKAQAVQLWTGETQQVQITVGAIGGAAVDPDSALYDNLVKAIDNARDPVQQVQVDSYERLRFNLEAKLLIDPRYLIEKVITEVQTALIAKFAFEARDFGQSVTAAEVIAAIQSIKGIIAVDLDALYRRDLARSREQALAALPARWDVAKRQILPAQLLLINSTGIGLSVEATL